MIIVERRGFIEFNHWCDLIVAGNVVVDLETYNGETQCLVGVRYDKVIRRHLPHVDDRDFDTRGFETLEAAVSYAKKIRPWFDLVPFKAEW